MSLAHTERSSALAGVVVVISFLVGALFVSGCEKTAALASAKKAGCEKTAAAAYASITKKAGASCDTKDASNKAGCDKGADEKANAEVKMAAKANG